MGIWQLFVGNEKKKLKHLELDKNSSIFEEIKAIINHSLIILSLFFISVYYYMHFKETKVLTIMNFINNSFCLGCWVILC